MADRIVIDQYNWDTQFNDQKTVDGNEVTKFINYIMTKTHWKMDADFLLEKVLRLRKHLAQDVREPEAFLVKANVKRDPALGKFVSKQ